MAETIESFVAKLQQDGVEAGQAAADQLRVEADAQACEIITQAEAKAAKILADAQIQADNLAARAKTELQLASRDIVLKLRDVLAGVVKDVLAKAAGQQFSDAEFLGKLLHEIVLLYAKADIAHQGQLQINVSAEMRQKLADWAIHEIGDASAEGLPSIELLGALKQAGFEYSVSGASIEVTVDSVVELLTELIAPSLRELLAEAVAQGSS